MMTSDSAVELELTRDIYEYINGVRKVFLKSGQKVKCVDLKRDDWLVGCPIFEILNYDRNIHGPSSVLGEGYDVKRI